MRIHSSVPLWLRWLIFFGLLGIGGFTLDGAAYADLTYIICSWLVFLWLVLFPGHRIGFPRLFGVAMLMWILFVPLFVLLLVSADTWNDLASYSSSRTQPALVRQMLLPYLVLFPALAVTLWNRLAAFRPLVIVTALYEALHSVLWYAPWHEGTSALDLWTFVLDLLFEVAVAAYLLLHFRERVVEARQTGAGSAAPAPQSR